ncbi:MAG: tRNA 2-thiouridine(34) synthase MnmA [Ruminococcus sp.]|nr:tRNA 2-thiouridine(34) synthase MnmA [Candidatus Copronaster equi]
MKKAMIAMSGGVDSSVAAYIVSREYDSIGATKKLFDSGTDDFSDAEKICGRLNIPYYVFDYTDNFKLQVIERFVDAYRNGRTPNPCIDCNRYMKFNQLMKRAQELNIDYVATGHYAIVEFNEETGRYVLKKAVDETKDQSYVLYSLTQEQLRHIILPLGKMTKAQAREIAEEQGFVNARKHDSQDICFVPDGDYAKFIEQWCGLTFSDGDFVDNNGNFIAKHKGIINYTIGQRKGLGVAAKAPYYVIKKDISTNQVVLGSNEDLFSSTLTATDVNFISIEKLTEPLKVKAKVRYRQKETDAVISPLENGDVRVEFETPQRAIASGQAVVFYDGDTVVGGGTII